MRKKMTAIIMLLCLLLAALPVQAENAGTAREPAYRTEIEDAAGLLAGEDEMAAVRAEMAPITEYCNAGFYTLSEYTGRDILLTAEKWAKKKFGDRDCIVFVIDMSQRELSIWASDSVLNGDLTTQKARMIVSNVYKMATAGRYGDCAKETFREIAVTLKGEKITSPMKVIGNILLAMIAAILLAYLLISTRMEQELKVSLPEVATVTAGIGAAIVGKKLTKVVHHESSSGGHGFGGGGGGGGSGGGGASHGF